jgi:hypothetical protein
MAESFPPPPPGDMPPPVEPPPPAPPPEPSALAWEQPGYPFLEGLYETAKLILTRPSEAFGRMSLVIDLGRPILFAVIFGWLGIIASQLWELVLRGALWQWMPGIGRGAHFALPLTVSVATMIFAPVLVLIGVFLWSAIVHLVLVILGAANGGFAATARVICYAQTPSVLQVVPGCGGVIALVWSLVLEIIGLAKAHRTTQGNAAVAVLLPIALCCACGVLAAAFFGAAIFAAISNLK